MAPRDVDLRESTADAGPDDKAQPERHADQPHALRTIFGLGDVRDVGARRAQVRGRDPAEDTRREQPQNALSPREPDTESGHRERRSGDRPKKHGPASHSVGYPAPDRDEQELHQRVDRAEERGHELADAEGVARLLRQEGQNEAEAEQIDEHRQKDGAEPRGRFHVLGAGL